LTFPGIFLAADSENAVFDVILDFRPEKPNQTEKFVSGKFIITEK
jgi:hypothetical protein